jgi:hypothetical protein
MENGENSRFPFPEIIRVPSVFPDKSKGVLFITGHRPVREAA